MSRAYIFTRFNLLFEFFVDIQHPPTKRPTHHHLLSESVSTHSPLALAIHPLPIPLPVPNLCHNSPSSLAIIPPAVSVSCSRSRHQCLSHPGVTAPCSQRYCLFLSALLFLDLGITVSCSRHSRITVLPPLALSIAVSSLSALLSLHSRRYCLFALGIIVSCSQHHCPLVSASLSLFAF